MSPTGHTTADERRGPDRLPDAANDRTQLRDSEPLTMRSLLYAILVPALIGFLAWAAKPILPVTVTRFEADSVRRDHEMARRDSVLNRVDSRVGVIYCASLPSQNQAGCR